MILQINTWTCFVNSDSLTSISKFDSLLTSILFVKNCWVHSFHKGKVFSSSIYWKLRPACSQSHMADLEQPWQPLIHLFLFLWMSHHLFRVYRMFIYFFPCAMLHGPLRGPSTHPDPPDAAFIVRIVLLRAMLSRTPGQRLLQGFNVENLEDLIWPWWFWLQGFRS